MTMSLCGPGLTTTSYKKPKQVKRTKIQQAAFEQEHREYNKRMKRTHAHDQMMSVQDYDLYVRGMRKVKTEFKEHIPTSGFRRETKEYPSNNARVGDTATKEVLTYSGERKLLGVATMHKSNMVPVFEDNKEIAIDIARMRR